ncbi:MAG: eukaryotic-like serine/threonine-protein kinase [Thermoanaerobaculia bacterium]|jgi:serine/threonine-protein kinase|nr:eukaryotic-like serine/threonine-protein kinase [Thermoanaerobaculia bacterium]
MRAQLQNRQNSNFGWDSLSISLSCINDGSAASPERGRKLMIGTLIGDRIRILRVLGQGGMGDVYEGVDERLNRKVAVKAIRADRRLSDESRSRFLREARALSALDHPNICRLFEYIESPEGDFLVLEPIEGVTLTRAIDAGMSRGRKLRIAEQIVTALAAAHRKGIVHRDLKPQNVMITSEGDAKILDFGIAQLSLESQDENHVQPVASGTTTLVFPIAPTTAPLKRRTSIAGTPAYMSPEQAVGGEITAASDLYSFGLLLQALLTEHDPQPGGLGQYDLLVRAARGITLPMTGEQRGVTTLVAKLKSLDPGDRPTAPEAQTALQQIIDAPKRRMRYVFATVAIVLVLFAAAKYAIDVTTARHQAERGRAQAEELVSFMVGDLRRQLEPAGRLDVLDGAASHALAYFASLRPEELTGEDLDHNARALAQLGQVREKQGKLPQAVELFRQSVRFAAAAVARDANRDEWQLSLSNARFYLGDAMRRQGDLRGALENFRAYFAISQRLAQRNPASLPYQAEVSYSHGNLGAVYEASGDLPHALTEYRLALDMDRQRQRLQPANEQWQADTANSANRLGVVLKSQGDFNGARQAFDEDLEVRRRLSNAAPNDAGRLRKLATSLAFAGTLQQATGDVSRALASFREEAALTEMLAKRDPTSAEARRNHAVAELLVASLLDPVEALPLAQSAVDDLRAIVKKDARPIWRRDLASALLRLSVIQSRAPGNFEAAKAAKEALTMGEALVAAQPNDLQSRRVLSDALVATANYDDAAGRPDIAKQRRMLAVATATSESADSALAAARVRALLAAGRLDQAAPLVATLFNGGYRDAEFLGLTAELRARARPPFR